MVVVAASGCEVCAIDLTVLVVDATAVSMSRVSGIVLLFAVDAAARDDTTVVS